MHTVICTGEEQHLMALECSGPPYLLYRRCLYTAAQLWLNESAMSFIETLLKILQKVSRMAKSSQPSCIDVTGHGGKHLQLSSLRAPPAFLILRNQARWKKSLRISWMIVLLL